MASDFVVQSLLQEVQRSLRPMLARWLSARELGLRKEEQVLLYLRAVRDAEKRAEAIGRLGPAARALLARCCGEERPLAAGLALARTSSAGYDVRPATLGELHVAGLAFFEVAAYWPGNAAWSVEHAQQEVVTPDGVRAAGLLCERAALQAPRCRTTLPKEAEAASARVAGLISECLQAVSEGAVRMTQEGAFAARTQRSIAAMWARHGAPEFPSAYTVVAFLRAAGIVQLESSGAVVPAAAFARERERPAPEHVAGLLNYQLEQCAASAEGIEEYGFAPRSYAADTLRTVLLALDAGEAVSVADCVELVEARAAAMTRGGGGVRGWSWPRSTQPTPGRGEWDRIVRGVVTELYRACGVVVECHDCHQRPCLALTAFGRYWLHGAGAPLHEHKHQQLIVQPDFTAVLTHTGPWDRTAQALRIFGEHSGDDNASVFRFSRERVQAAARHGHQVEELLDVLEARATYPVPENVRTTLREWGTPAAEAVLHRDANVLWFDSRAARDAFVASGRCRARPLGEQFALLREPQRAALEVMQTLGAQPVDYGQTPTAGIAILPDGSVTSAAAHDLRIAALRAAIAEPAPAGTGRSEWRWVVSARRLRACDEPAQLFQQLVRLPGTPLSVAVRVQLLVLLGLVPRVAGGTYAVLENVSAGVRTQLKKRIPWREAVLFDGTPQMVVVAAPFASAVRSACAGLGVELMQVSIEPPAFEVHE